MSGITYVPLSNELLVRLIGRYKENYEGLIEYAVEDFLDRTEEDFRAETEIPKQGYVWDQVTLPHGTELRTKYYGEWRVATLNDGKFLYDGKSFDSPAQVCNAMRDGTSNNAWLMMEIKRLQDISFRGANHFRR